jgi:hypothetical protein
MGIDKSSLELILLSQNYVKNTAVNKKANILTLGRQQIHIFKNDINYLLHKYKFNSLIDKFNVSNYSENLFINLFEDRSGYNEIFVDSIDNSNYEGASIIHNMNNPFISTKKYQYIYDGGTIEHIFNIPQVIENVIDMLDIDGLFVSITCNNNFSGHGIYQFSPEFFLSSLNEKYGMKIEAIYLGKVHTPFEEWIDVNDYKGGRNCTKFDDCEPVYILTIARKISNKRENLLSNSPHQYSYEQFDWKKS